MNANELFDKKVIFKGEPRNVQDDIDKEINQMK